MKKYIGLVWAGVILSFIGLTNSFYLVQSHVSGEPLNCSILNGCNAVAASPYSIVLGVPLASWGVLFYFGMFVLAATMLMVRVRMLSQLFTLGASIGFLASLYFVYLQFFVIGAVCMYCMLSAILATLLIIVALLIIRIPKEAPRYTDLIPPMMRREEG
ncbi:MAG: vitamin K epoxide reductase family protein [Patescibacteria group bacterium UBA2103]